MYVVLEEVEEGIARLIPDSSSEALYIPVRELPETYEIGDVFLIEDTFGSGGTILKKDNSERDRRLKINQKKREKLLNLSKNKERDH
ncbi:MAG: hypothetical protein ABS873_00975 [Alkalibacterium sp.]